MNVLFCDSSHPKIYDFDTLKKQAIGGTESSLLRIADILASHNHQVTIFQQAREDANTDNQVRFIGPNQINHIKQADAIVVLRKDKQLKHWQQRFPTARTYLWLHTYKKWEFVFKRLFKHNRKSIFIGNSQTHVDHLNQRLHHNWLGRLMSLFGVPKIKLIHAYNPVPKPHLKQSVSRNNNQMIFLSAPNKGLNEVLEQFKSVRDSLPDMTLLVANPGYRNQQNIHHPGVKNLGALPQSEVWQHVASSLCVFYPQTGFAETFGLIYAEANALGTPVLAHDIGAAREILHPANPLINCHERNAVSKCLQQWQNNLPEVNYRRRFAAKAIHDQWLQLLSSNSRDTELMQ